MMPQSIPTEILELHALYCRLTGSRLELNWCRIDSWRTWISYRKHQPFTSEDLKVVVGYFKRTRKGGILDGSLKFHKLIQNADFFEEDLSIARQALRPRPSTTREQVTPGTTTRRIVECDGEGGSAIPVAELIRKMRIEADKAVRNT